MSAREDFPTAFSFGQAVKSMARNLHDNPVVYREGMPRLLRRLDRRWRWLLLGSAVAGCAAGGPVLGAALRDGGQVVADSVGMVLVLSWAWIGSLVTAIHAAGSVSKERAAGTWDLLLVTRLGKWGVLTGKFLAAVLPMFVVGSCLCLLASGIAWAQPSDRFVLGLQGICWGWLGGVAAVAFSVCVGLFWSCRCSSQWVAVLLTLFTLWFTGPAGAVLLLAFTGGRWP